MRQGCFGELATARPYYLFAAGPELIAVGEYYCFISNEYGTNEPALSCGTPPSPVVRVSTDGGVSWTVRESVAPASLLRHGSATAAAQFYSEWVLCVIGGIVYGTEDPTRSVLCSSDGGASWVNGAPIRGAARMYATAAAETLTVAP